MTDSPRTAWPSRAHARDIGDQTAYWSPYSEWTFAQVHQARTGSPRAWPATASARVIASPV
ncbi:MAG: hypothetical protein R3E83_00175 [Burkholderiaceae bacterium]